MKDYKRNKDMPQATTIESALAKMIEANGHTVSTECRQKRFRNEFTKPTDLLEQGIKDKL
jgi:hypothetical protein